jgi:hypothetical protein
MLAVAPSLHQPRPPQELQVSGRVGERQTGPRGEILHTARDLAEMLQQLEAMSVAERLRDLRETGEYLLFRAQA